MPNLVNAYVIYNGTQNQFVGDDYVTISINCERLQAFSPRPVWLKRFLAPGDGTVILYEPTFNPTSDELLDSNILQGFWIEQDGYDVMIDVTTQAAFQNACDACCGTVPTIIASNWNGNVPDFVASTLNTYCIYRIDDGSQSAHNNFAWAYSGKYINTAVMRSNFSNTSHYTIQSYFSLAQMKAILQSSGGVTDTIYVGACAS